VLLIIDWLQYEDYGPSLVNYLEGMYAFVLYDSKQDRYIAARDPVGIVTLYQGWSCDGSVWFASEMKSIFEDCCDNLVAFEPGTLYDSRTNQADRWYKPQWWDEQWAPKPSAAFQEIDKVTPAIMAEKKAAIQIDDANLKKVREALIKSVETHLMSEVPYGVLLSGGLDSSLIAAIAARCAAKSAQTVPPGA
jgi:asparagine synthase (glutamine-hydrolysing)